MSATKDKPRSTTHMLIDDLIESDLSLAREMVEQRKRIRDLEAALRELSHFLRNSPSSIEATIGRKIQEVLPDIADGGENA